MPGGGGVVAANYLFQMAKPDGLIVGVLSRGMPVLWAAGARGIEYDASAFRWIGSPSTDITARVARGPKDIRDMIGSPKPLILGATGRGAGSFQVPSALNAALGTNIKIIAGYKGAPEMHAAMERGEIDGRCASYFATKVYPFLQEGLDAGTLRIIVQLPGKHREIPHVPVANDLVTDPAARSLFNLVAFPFPPWVVPPGTPEDRLAALREGFMKAFSDSEFRRTAEKAGLEMDPVPGDKAEVMAREFLNVPERTRQVLKEILNQ
jgi:tripartite-type tricarboxylate transporter receptor subunit TctC